MDEPTSENHPSWDFESNKPHPPQENESAPENHPAWDWNRNRGAPHVDEPTSENHPSWDFESNKPHPANTGTSPEDHPAWDWNRNRGVPGVDEPTSENHPSWDFESNKPNNDAPEDHPNWDWNRNRGPPSTDEDHADWDFDQHKPDPDYALEPIENPDVVDGSAPWASSPDDESDDGRGPKPMAVPDDLYSEPSSEGTKQEPKGTVLPVWLFLTVAVMASVLGATAVSGPPPVTSGLAPGLFPDPNAPIEGIPPKLPQMPPVAATPCAASAACGFVMGALDPVFPPSTMALINIPGTCQNWAREWLRTGKDVMEFNPDRIRQRFSMALLYCEFNGDNWLEGELWVSDLHECDWYSMIGVDPCSRNEEYQIIRNYGQQMRGTLPPELSMLSSLWEVTLSDNLIEGTIPADYSKLTQLDTFSLSFNLLTGTIPDFMWEYEDMVHLDLAYNFFKGTIPDSLHLTEPNLKVLFVENNDLSGTIPATFNDLQWHRLHLDGNAFSGPIPEGIISPDMDELYLNNNRLTGTFPTGTYEGPNNLKEMKLGNNEIKGDFDEMCKSMNPDGKLEVLEVDLSDPGVTCKCCSEPL